MYVPPEYRAMYVKATTGRSNAAGTGQSDARRGRAAILAASGWASGSAGLPPGIGVPAPTASCPRPSRPSAPAGSSRSLGTITDPIDGFLLGMRHLIMDRDAIFTAESHKFLKQEGIKAVRLPPRSPNLNAHAERFVRTIKEGCLNRMIFFGEDSLRRAINEFLTHYHHERNHQGLGDRLLDPGGEVGVTKGPIACRQRLGGLLRHYYRQTA